MKTILNLLIVLALIFCFTSCQREPEETIPTLTASDSAISKIITRDTTLPAGVDTVQFINFYYDGSGRLSKVTNVYYFTGVSGPGRLDGYEEWVYNYNGTQTVPFKVMGKYFVYAMPTAIDYDTTYLYYTGGFLSKDSITAGFNDYDVTEFTKLSDTRYKVIQKRPDGSGGVLRDSGYTQVSWVGNNLVQEIDSTWRPFSGIWEVRTSTATYDNKIHPFKNIAVPHPAPFHYDFPVFGFTELALVTENNVTSLSSGSFNEVFNYKYGPTGLPVSIIYNGLPGEKSFIYYIKL